MTEDFADLGDIRLHFVEEGEGPLVVLLHGFPDFWYSWRRQIPFLAKAGYRVVAPDMRGYNLSGKPQGVDAYRITRLAGDIGDLVGHLGADRAVIAGHDWGGVVAWSLPIFRPEVVDRLVILNAPHPAVMFRELLTPGQALRSWYFFFFQLPRLPEELVRAALPAIVKAAGGTEDDLALYVEAAARPGALTATVNYYRAAMRAVLGATPEDARLRDIARQAVVDSPVLLLWGLDDPVLGPRLTEGLEPWVRNLRVMRLPGVSHWPHLESPATVNQELLAFIQS
ncbi:MAG: alpha/beta fold hydrolase [Candidatus Sericytochromatia bacterium]|uniref:Alpha/beta fold hydrolase n=1 Tax=Candidatus Tanganyikabacteria bacterium TaxID=2961651 RepID=A0A937X019_9BACT|nr:alpha/beta fold hydrolase [Candidatus Tanganyikabacteria bacterium]